MLAIDKNNRINEQIRVPQVRVIAGDGQQLGVLETHAALAIAREQEMDLVEVAPTEKPPVCRIMDYGKFKYSQRKKSHKHTHHTKIKEIRVRPKTGDHDILTKVNQAKGFLSHKDKVIVSVVFRGRELAHIEEGQRMIKRVLELLDESGKPESPPSQQGKRIVCTIVPK
jgi:translation initiation factor IF-3